MTFTNCWICNTDLKTIKTSVQANLINNTITYSNYYNTKHKYYFPNYNKTTCFKCFKQLTIYENLANKYLYLKKK